MKFPTTSGWWEEQRSFMLISYVGVLGLVWVVATMILSCFEDDKKLVKLSLTATNFIHFVSTLIYLHWLKGACTNDQGDLDHLTVWEQIEATPGTGTLRLILRLIPTLLCYIACWDAGWGDAQAMCTINVIIWSLAMLGKMPFMNGVRILGINRHPVIDDEN
jgi:hypothetical protein